MSIHNDLNITGRLTDTNTSAHHRQIRYFAAAVTAVITIIYFMIGFNVVSVVANSADQIFGIFAGLAYGLGIILLLAVDRRAVWIVGAVFQVFVIVTYFRIAPQRTPAYEVWGIVLRIAQAILLIGLAYLSVRSPQQTAALRKSRA